MPIPKILSEMKTLLNLSSSDAQRRKAISTLLEWNGEASERKSLVAELKTLATAARRSATSVRRAGSATRRSTPKLRTRAAAAGR